MYPKFFPIKIRRRSYQIITIAAILLLMTISTASATLLTINTNDLTAIDWGSQPQFHSDPSGDVDPLCAGGDARDDIIETFVASGPSGPPGTATYIYFLVKFAETDTGLGSLQYHKISAYMDCTPFGEDAADANVLYGGYYDQVTLADGNLPNPNAFKNYDLDGSEGQRVPNDTANYTLEWKGSFFDMAQFVFPGPLNCRPDNIARIKFTSVSLATDGSYLCTYDDTGWRDFDTPTAIEKVSIKAENEKGNSILITAIIIAIVGSIGLFWSWKLKT